MRRLVLAGLAVSLAACAGVPRSGSVAGSSDGGGLLAGAWGPAEIDPILEKTRRLRLTMEPGVLTPAEEAALPYFLDAGAAMQRLYLAQRHPQALAAEAALEARPDLDGLSDLFRLMKGPIATTLDNERVAFLNVAAETPGKAVYPDAITREVLDAYLADHPERAGALLDQRAVVWEAGAANVRRVRRALDAHPTLDVLHPGLRAGLADADAYVAVPYSVAYADEVFTIYDDLNAAADLLADGDPAFARFLHLRARDLLADDYEGGDAAWVTGTFRGNLNAEIGSYETYDDALYGVKSFFAFSLLQRDIPRSRELAAAIGDIQVIEDALPYDAHKRVRPNIPVAVYNVLADFGQARGTNTATILPNDSHLARQYGRTILIRANILTNPELFAAAEETFNAAVDPRHHGDLAPDGQFQRTLWHEIGHYLGVDQTVDGGDLDAALQDTADLLEEMKADLVSLFAAQMLHDRGFHDDARLKAIYAGGVRRVLQTNQPRRDQPYQTMQLIQWNWFLEHGVLAFDGERLSIDYAAYPAAVESLLREVLALQRAGDRDATNAFVDRWTAWDENLHGVIAQRMRDAATYRYSLVRYEALGE